MANTDPNNAPRTVTFEVWYTTAPVAYDGGDVITFVSADDSGKYDLRGNALRGILVPPASREWQLGRNASGLHGTYSDAELKAFEEA